MRLPGRISAAIEVLDDIASRHRPVSAALRDWGLAHRFSGSSDRAAVGNLVYDALRKRRSVAWRMGADTSRALAVGVAGLEWGMSADDLAKAFAGDTHAPDPLTGQERARLDDPPAIDDAPDAIRADVPDWCAASLQLTLGAGWVAEAQALADRPPLDLRVNSLKADRDRVLSRLTRLGAIACNLSPVGIRIPSTDGNRRHPNVRSDEAFQRGRVEIQDEGSQLAALLTGAAAGRQVLDYCAGAGGKTLAMAAMMENRGQIHAHDSDRNRLAGIYERLKRAGARNVQVRPPGEDALSGLEGRMDLVLVDAPCIGSGVWRRHPDSKWRVDAEALAARQDEQADILGRAAGFVRPGGLMIYVTCSLFEEENGRQIERFISRSPDFAPAILPGTDSLGPILSRPDLSASDGASAMLLTPARTQTDGFFVAALRRT